MTRKLIAFGVAAAAICLLGFLALLRPALGRQTGQSPSAPSCGTAVNMGTGYAAGPINCLWQDYLSRKVGQAVVVQYTIEGDPIKYSVEYDGAAGVLVHILSNDRFGAQGQFSYRCTGLERSEYAGNPGRYRLIATRCTGPTPFLDDQGRVTIP